MNAPDHVRRNHEATEDKLADLGALLIAADHMVSNAEIPLTPETDAFFVLLRMAQDTHRAARRAHLVEWAGMGGFTGHLTEAEIAAARGEATEADA